MKKSLLVSLLALTGASLAVAADESKECSPLSAKVTQDVTAKKADVLSIVSEQIALNPTCACEIVKAAILAAKADKDLVGQIVFTAVTAAPTEAATIAECAVAVAPEAAETIKSALKKAMSDDKNPSDKNPGKNVVDKNPPPAKDAETDFGLSPVAIGGVYLVYPSSGASGPQLVKKNGKLGFIGPDGEFVPLNPPPTVIVRPPGKPDVIIIRPPTQTGPTGN